MENKSTGSPASAHDRPWMNTSLSPDERADLVLAQLTLEEKISMVHGRSNDAYAMVAIARLGVGPPVAHRADGLHKLSSTRAHFFTVMPRGPARRAASAGTGD